MTEQSLRYHAASRYTYAVAVVRLYELAHEGSAPPFEFGPVRLEALEQNGLEVTGSDLRAVTDVLRDVPGLALIDAQGV